jgi:hypothetical protein
MMNEYRPQWYLITGLIIGLVFGVYFAWQVSPVEHIDTHPGTFQTGFKNEYRAAIAAAFVANGDVGRAQARLALLGDSNTARTLASQAQMILAEGGSQEAARYLGLLAAALDSELSQGMVSGQTGETGTPGIDGSQIPVESGTPEFIDTGTVSPSSDQTYTPTSGPTLTPIRTTTPLPTRTPTATQGAAYRLEEYSPICDPVFATSILQVYAYDASRRPVPGVEIVVTWGETGEDRFFTGLKPEFGLGYADFEMIPEEIYDLRLTDGGEPLVGLAAIECETEDGDRYWGSWMVTFVQP